MWIYIQRTGELIAPSGEIFSGGYSGHGACQNNPDKQDLRNLGPIPRGRWIIDGPPITSALHGPYVLHLTPHPKTPTFGRSGFLIHGDSIKAPGTASEGCIIEPRNVRETVWHSGVSSLLVIAEREDIPV